MRIAAAVLVALLAVPGVCAASSEGTDLVIGFVENKLPDDPTAPELRLIISGAVGTTGTVSAPGIALSSGFSIPAAGVQTILLPGTAQATGTNVVTQRGIRVTASAPVTVHAASQISPSADGASVLPVSALGTGYIVLTAAQSHAHADITSQFVVVAVEDNTTVTITPTISTALGPANTGYQVVLNQLDTFQLKSDALGEDPTGTVIVSDKPVAVFAGGTCLAVGAGGFCSHLFEQLRPVSAWSTRYFTMPLGTSAGGDYLLRLLASQDSTAITYNPSVPGAPGILDNGAFADVVITAGGSVEINATQPVLAMQFSRNVGGTNPTPFMVMLPGVDGYRTSQRLTIPDFAPFNAQSQVAAAVLPGAVNTCTLDGASLSGTPSVPIGTSGFSAVELLLAAGSHVLACPAPLGAIVYGSASNQASFGYPAASFVPVPPAQAKGLVISQVYGGAGIAGATYTHDFIELHNNSGSPIALDGMALKTTSGPGTNWRIAPLPSVVVPPGGYFLVQGAPGLAGHGVALPTPDHIAPSNFTVITTSGKVALTTDVTQPGVSCPPVGTLVDFLGFAGEGSDVDCAEGDPLRQYAGPTNALLRRQGGCLDLGSNEFDFYPGFFNGPTIAPGPRNSTVAYHCPGETMNETNQPVEANACSIVGPSSITASAGSVGPVVTARLFEAGVTEAAGASSWIAQVGYGPEGLDPATQAGFSWFDAAYSAQVGNADEYTAQFTLPPAGAYRYAARFGPNGTQWTYCDLDGAGSDPGLSFSVAQLGTLTSTAGVVPTAPGMPTSVVVTPNSQQLTVSFAAPPNGGSAITSYAVTADPDAITVIGAGSPLVLANLVNGTAYTVTVRATNAIGTGPASLPVVATPATLPLAPAQAAATAGNAQARVSFVPPGFDGGSPITSYTVTSSPGGFTATGAASPITVSSLTNGTEYTFTVTATNAAGTGPASAPSNSVIPQVTAGKLVISQVYAGGGTAGATYTNDFIELHNNSGAPINVRDMAVQYASATGTTWSVKALPSSSIPAGGYYLIGGGSDGAVGSPLPTMDANPFPFFNMNVNAGKVALTSDAVALSGACPASLAVIDLLGYGAAADCREGSPTADLGNAIGARRKANGCQDTQSNSADFDLVTPVARNSSSPSVACGEFAMNETNDAAEADQCSLHSPSTISGVSGSAGPIVLARLFETNVTEAAGASSWVAQIGYTSSAASPVTVPSSFTWLTATFNAQVGSADEYRVNFTLPAAGNYKYVARFSPDGQRWTYCDLDGAGSNAGASFSIAQMGTMTVTPAASVPLMPLVGTVTAGNGQATVPFLPPGSDGGSPITSYTVTSNPGGITASGPSSPITVTGLTNGVSYTFTVTATNAIGTGLPSPQSNSVTPTDPNPPRLGNISTRMQVLTGNDVMIGGFVIGGFANKTVAIVATGPSLTAFGITNALANPTLTLVRSSDQATIATNDDWQTAPNQAQLAAAGFAPSNALEAAILVNLPPGAYTAIVQGANNGTGVAVVGVYEVDGLAIPLINISTRGRVLTGNDVMIGGFVIQGSAPQTVAIVATGPSLAQFGIASPLANPTITLVRSSDQVTLATNDDWQADASASQLQAAGFAPSNTLESALYRTLPAGAYTVIVEGVGGGTGVAVIGVYKVN